MTPEQDGDKPLSPTVPSDGVDVSAHGQSPLAPLVTSKSVVSASSPADDVDLAPDDLDLTFEDEQPSPPLSPAPRRTTTPPPAPVDAAAPRRTTTIPPVSGPILAHPLRRTTIPPTPPAPALPRRATIPPAQPPASVVAPVAPVAPPIEKGVAPSAIGPTIAESRRLLTDAAWPDRLASIDRELSRETDPVRRAVLEYEAGLLLAGPAADEQRGIAAFERAMALDPTLKHNLWTLRRIHERRGHWDKVLAVLEVEMGSASAPSEWAELLVDKAHLLRDHLDSESDADQALRTALIADGSSLPAIMALERLAVRRGDLPELARLVRLAADAAQDPARKTELILDLARLAAAAGPSDEVYALLHEAHAIGAAPDRVLDELERYATKAAGRGETEAARADVEIEKALGLRIEAAEAGVSEEATARAVALRRRQAQILRAHDPVRARESLEAALARAPGDALVLGDLTELAADEERWGDLADLLGRHVATAAGEGALRLKFARARALRRAGRDAEADAVGAELAAEPSVGMALLVDRQRQAIDAGDLGALAAGFRDEAGRAQALGDLPWAAHAWSSAAAVHVRLGDEAAAIGDFQAALAAVPGDPVALDGIEPLLARAGRHGERADVLGALLAISDGASKVRLLELLIDLRLRLVPSADVDGAMEAAAALCEADVDGGGGALLAARARLVEIARATERWAPLAEHLDVLARALAKAGESDRAVELSLERADVLESRLGDAAGARAAVEMAVRENPAHPEAAAELRRLCAKEGQWEAVGSSLRAQIERTPDTRVAARLLVELARLEERLGRTEPAEAAWKDLSDRAPATADAARLRAEASGNANEAAQALARSLAVAGEGETTNEAAARLIRLGEHYEDVLGDPAAAGAAYRRASSLFGDAPSADQSEVAAHAVFGLYRSLARSTDDNGLDGALRALALFAHGTSAAAIAEERAAMALAAGDLAGAREHIEEAVAADVGFLGTRLLQQRLATFHGNAAERAATLAALGAATADPRLKAVYLARSTVMGAMDGTSPTETAAALADLADLANSPGQPPPTGPTTYGLAPADRASLAVAMDALTDDPRLLARRIESATPQVAAGLRIERVEALLARGRLAEAGEEVMRALASEPDDVLLLEAARRIAWRGGDRLSEARAGARLGMALSSGTRASTLLTDSARTLEELGERAEAAAVWRAVVIADADDEAAFARARALLAGLGDDGALEELLTRRLAHVAVAAERIPLLVERGELLARTGRPRAAAADFRAAASVAPARIPVLRRLGDHLAAFGDFDGAVNCYERITARLQPGDPAARELHLATAALHERHGDLPRAALALRHAIALDSDDEASIERLATVLEKTGDATGAIEQLRARARLATGVDRARFEQRAAGIHHRLLHDPQGAKAALGRALAAEPLNLDALTELISLCEDGDQALVRDGALTQAAREAQRALDLDAARPEAYRVIERVLEWQGDEDGRQLATQALAVLAGRTLPPRRDLPEPSRPLPADLWKRTAGLELGGIAAEVWRETAEGSLKIFGPDPASLGATRSTRQNEKALPPAWAAVDRLAKHLGVGSYVLHVVPRADVCVVSGDVLLLGSAYAAPLGPTERFRVAHKLIFLRERLGPLETASDGDLDLYFAACAQVAGVSWEGASRQAPNRVDEWARLIGKAIDRKAKKALTALAPRFAQIVDLPGFRRRLLDGATRLALAVAGDLGGALAALPKGPSDPVGASTATGRSLARYAVSDELATIRRALGMRV